MGLTESHWFENEEPELTERQLEDIISMQERFYRLGYQKGYSDGTKKQEIKPYKFKRVQATYIGMNFETGELNHYYVYECPHCGDEVTKSMAQEWKYCPKCGNPVKWE